MKRFRWRLRPLIVLASVGVVSIGLAIAYSASLQFLRTRLTTLGPAAQISDVIDEFSGAFLAFSAIAVVLTAVVSLLLGSAAVRALSRLRSDADARARGMAQPPCRPPVVEMQAVAAAIERLASNLDGQVEQLRREKDELAALVHSVSEGILLIEPGGRIHHANPAARSLLGLPDASTGQPLSSLVRNAELRAIAERLGRVAEPVTREVSVGDRRLLVAGRPIADSMTSAALPGAVVAIVDLTELRRLEGVRRDFVANVSHELKTPLTSIRGYAETLLADDLDPVTKRQFLEVIQKNADRLHSIVNDLLDLSKIESGGWRPTLREVGVTELIADVWESCADRAREKHIQFQPPRSGARVSADDSALRQVLSNLFDNAIRHTGAGGSIRVSLHEDPPATNGASPHASSPRSVTIEVQDTGSGIPIDSLPRIFERFYRVDPARSRAEGGTGLGLSIVKHLVEGMNGEVSASSELGKGTTIRVRLPASSPEPS